MTDAKLPAVGDPDPDAHWLGPDDGDYAHRHGDRWVTMNSDSPEIEDRARVALRYTCPTCNETVRRESPA